MTVSPLPITIHFRLHINKNRYVSNVPKQRKTIMDYFHFANMPFIIFIGFLTIVALVIYFSDRKDEIANFLLGVIVILFAVSLYEPYTINQRVKENIANFIHDEKLKCNTNNNDSYIVSNDEWNLEGDFVINNKNKLAIRIDHCKKY